MKKIISMVAFAAILVSLQGNAQEQKPTEKAKKECSGDKKKCSAAEMKACKKDKKTCTAAEMKTCSKDKKAGCCAAKAKS